MKNYYGDALGNVTMSDDSAPPREIGRHEWGNTGPSAAALALTLVTEVTGDKLRAEKLYRQFMHRTTALWPTGRPWGMSEDELKAVIDAIVKVEAETAPAARKMASERPTPVSDAAPPGGAWDQSPKIEPNVKKERRDDH